MNRSGPAALVMAVVTSLTACGGDSDAASCAEFLEEYKTFGNPKTGEMVWEAYSRKFPDEKTIKGGVLMYNIGQVKNGCEEHEKETIDEFLERDAPSGW